MKQTIDNTVLPEPTFLAVHLEDLGRADVVLHPYAGGRDLTVVNVP